MSEQVPAGWSVSNLGQHIDILSGFPFKSSEFTNDPSDFGLIRIRDLLGQKLETFYAGEYSTDFIVKIGDILVGMDGDFHIVQWKSQNALLNQRICKLVPKKGGFDINFVHYCLIPALKKIHNQTTATTVKHLSVKDIREVEQAFPPLPEQKKIASILTSVDDVIENTQRQIAKLQDLKKATMNELLTKGIGHTEFKDSELGRIPKSWEVAKLGAVSSRITDGTHQAVKTTPDGTIPFLYVSCVKDQSILWEKSAYISEQEYSKASQGRQPNIGDILYTSVGSYGNAVLVAEDKQFCFQRHIALIQLSPKKVFPKFMETFLISDIAKKQADKLAVGNAQLTVTLGELRKFEILLPPVNEQREICQFLQPINDKLAKTKLKLEQLISLKKSLMQDLLTGKVRVQVN